MTKISKQTKPFWIAAPILVVIFLWLIMHLFNAGAVKVVNPARGSAVDSVYATGTVEATVMLPIASRNTARLMELNVDEGSKVIKGQLLAKLEDDDLQKTISELRAKELFAKNEYERVAAVFAKGYATKRDRDQAKSDWDSAVASVERAIEQADFMKLIAPADGTIIRRDGELGELISANQAVFWLTCCAPLRITAEVDEENIPEVQPGQKVLIRADAMPGKIFNGTVQSITPKGDPVARSYRVRINFAEETPLMIGMTAETNIILHERENSLLVPASVVKDRSLWLVRDGKLVKQEVKIGASGPEQIEIVEGITEQDKIVLHPNSKLIVGEKVRASLVRDKK